MSSIKILVAAHKKSLFPKDDIFLPIQVGKKTAKENLSIQGDDEGDNISEMNPSFCELTAIYWAWKNLKDNDYIGLCHYRRYFNFHHRGIIKKDVTKISTNSLLKTNLSIPNLDKLFKKYDVLIPKPRVYPYNLSIEYSVSHISSDYKILEEVVSEISPEYIHSFRSIFYQNNKLSHYNMFIMKSQDFEKYSIWLFKILFEVQKRIDISDYDTYQSRIYGFFAERLQYIYIHANNFRVKTYPIFFVDDNQQDISIARYVLGRIRNKLAYNIMQQSPSYGLWKIFSHHRRE